MDEAIQLILAAFYVVLMVCCVFERKYDKGLYWLGALLITVAVWRMK